ncbi:hypothetical protein CGT72_00615 [Vibrio cholerae]|uniref:glycosyltransferase family 2 protein n=1 Tax=Vibrio cholerae TaxID=666 RepID=UPI000BA9CD7B|nr:glycosyltransferase family 2 protein [Vibrio cholerae]ELU8558890.1 glycosyltransferase family 2 protein [Vibrio cholerae]PAS36200.1 hypothetical protein CGT72_00615 [Vibrio cholerae]
MAYYPKPSISVIMPVYNTEMYIERAIVSLMEQTLQNIQFIIIDDGSNDDSLEIIKSVMSRYPERQKQLTLISRENRGVAFTRAEGLAIADGEYIIHMDSDDFVAINWLESLYCKALEESADVVICDFDMYLKNKIISVREMVKKNPDDCVRYLLTGKLSNSNCNKLIRKKIISENDISYLTGLNMGEDFYFILKVLYFSRNISYVGESLYSYNRTNESSLTYYYSESSLNDLKEVVKMVSYFIREVNSEDKFNFELNVMKLGVKNVHLLYSGRSLEKIKESLRLYPESNCLVNSNYSPLLLRISYLLYRVKLSCIIPLLLLCREIYAKK